MTAPRHVYSDLNGASVLVSGGASGIGADLVKRFAEQGAKVAFVDIMAEQGDALAASINEAGGTALFLACDLTDCVAYQATIEQAAEAHGPISVLVNNAASDIRHSLESITPAKFDALVSVNLKHQLFAAQSVVPMMIKQGGGSIINFGSFGWMINTSGYPVYAACKAAIHGMTRGLARELGQHHIRVNTLVPGWVMTDKQERLWVDDAARELIDKNQCLTGLVLPEHISNMALFLASDASVMCSAQNFIVDGGWA